MEYAKLGRSGLVVSRLCPGTVRFATGDGVSDAGLSRRRVLEACEASLRRLGTGRIDLYQVHMRDER